MKRSVALALALFSSPLALADVTLPSVFADHMVLQRDEACPVWGMADPGEAVSVRFAGHFATTLADADGRWQVSLPARPASATGQTLEVMGNNQIVLQDVLIGEVWVCSGQSNMEWNVASSNDAQNEIAAGDHPRIRLFKPPHVLAMEPQFTVAGQWTVCSPQTVGAFSAVAYFFGRNLMQTLDVPVGLISTNWGGTRAEPWTAPAALASHPLWSDTMKNLREQMAAYDAQDADERERNYQEALAAFQPQVEKYWQAIAAQDPGMKEGYAKDGHDDARWDSVSLPGLWDAAGGSLPGHDGFVWYRRKIEIPADWAGKELVLSLGAIDDSDHTWFGGESAGSMIAQHASPRRYTIPAARVKAGPTSITVLVLDTGGAGGLTGPADAMVLRRADGQGSIPLSGAWKQRKGGPIAPGVAAPAVPRRQQRPGANAGTPGTMYNAMIHPFVPYAIRGATWYQGESNAGQPEQYRELLPLMIGSWRQAWGQGDFPFGVVQLASFQARSDDPVQGGWAFLRDAQLNTALTVPRVGLVVTTDVGDARDIHPRNKQEVGRRLALWARATVYGEDVEYSGPLYRSMTRRGRELVLHFDHAEGLGTRDGQPPRGFALGDERGHFVWAQARIEGDTVVVSAADMPMPTAVRYGWCNNPEDTNLVNAAGLPATPFRSDGPR